MTAYGRVSEETKGILNPLTEEAEDRPNTFV